MAACVRSFDLSEHEVEGHFRHNKINQFNLTYLMRILGLRNVRHEALLLAVEVDEDEADQDENAQDS